MAIIGSIQEKGRYFLVGFVGLALLTFILTGLFDASGKAMDTGNIGTISGEEIDPVKYQENVDQFRNNVITQSQQQGQQPSEQQLEQADESAWRYTVDQVLLGKEFDALGIEVSDNELDSYLYGEAGFPLLPDIQRGFSDSITGQFNAKKLEEYINSMENSKDAQQRSGWENSMKQIREQRRQEKYFQLLQQGVYVTKLEAKEDYLAKNEVKSISYIFRSFNDLATEQVKITDAEVRDFYDKHKSEKKYELLAGRSVKYFDVVVQPSRADSVKFNRELKELKSNFEKTKSDSLFVLANAETKMGLPKTANPYRSQSDPNAKSLTYPAYADTIIKAASVGQVVQYADLSGNGKQYLAKVLGFNNQSLSARHILLTAQRTDTKAVEAKKKIADSLTVILNADKSRFEEFVTMYSEDGGSKDKGGKYEDFSKDEFVKEFSNFTIEKPVGTIGVVQTDFGFHIIEVLGKKDARIPLLAVIDRSLIASDETESALKDKAYNLLYQFDAKLSKKSDMMEKLNLFDTLARKEGYFARPINMDEKSPRVTGFTTKLAQQKILGLAFDEEAEVGRLCDAPINDKGRYIIAIVTSIHEKGEPSYEDAYLRMKEDAIKEKKANKYKLQIGSERNLAKLAKKFHLEISNAEVTFANPGIQNAGNEPKIVGALFSGLKDGQTTVPLVGDNGVFVIRLNKTIKAKTAANYEQERMQLLTQARGNVQSARNALELKNEVYDNRELQQIRVFR